MITQLLPFALCERRYITLNDFSIIDNIPGSDDPYF